MEAVYFFPLHSQVYLSLLICPRILEQRIRPFFCVYPESESQIDADVFLLFRPDYYFNLPRRRWYFSGTVAFQIPHEGEVVNAPMPPLIVATASLLPQSVVLLPSFLRPLVRVRPRGRFPLPFITQVLCASGDRYKVQAPRATASRWRCGGSSRSYIRQRLHMGLVLFYLHFHLIMHSHLYLGRHRRPFPEKLPLQLWFSLVFYS